MEADRGEDLGLVTERIDNTIQFKEKVENNKILRIATDEEIRALPAKLIEENKALVFIRNKVQNFGYDMEVHDAEFQFDCHKLTFYYRADRRIDFRELVATLCAQFKTRIWMQRTNDTRDKIEPYKKFKKPNDSEREALKNLVVKFKEIDSSLEPEEIQTIVYSVGKQNGYEKNLRDWFKLIYEVVFGVENGPRIGFFVKFFGLKETIELINDKLN